MDPVHGSCDLIYVCRGSIMVTTSDFQSGRLGSSPSRDHYSMMLDRGTGLIHRYQSG